MYTQTSGVPQQGVSVDPPVRGACTHLALLLDGLLARLALRPALLPVALLGGDPRQVRVVDALHALRLPGRGAPGGQHVQRDAQLRRHPDGFGLVEVGGHTQPLPICTSLWSVCVCVCV